MTDWRPSYHTRVERWECDYNDHWNVRFFGRAFQAASEMIAGELGGANPGAPTCQRRHMRFHSELRVSDPVEIHSAVLVEAGDLSGTVIHEMRSGDRLAATALDLGAQVPGGLPQVSAADLAHALPRGITAPVAPDAPNPGARVTHAALGPMRGEDLDHQGHIRFDVILRHASNMQHFQLNELGLTPEFAGRQNINRMGVEFRVTRGATPPPGAVLRGRTWISAVEGKTFWAMNTIETPGGVMTGQVEMCVVTVDLTTRKACAVPDFMYNALGRQD